MELDEDGSGPLAQVRAQSCTSEATRKALGSRPAILAIILISYVMIVLDISIVITGLPRIHRDLGFTDAGLSWVSSAYTLTFGGFLLLGARAGDILGRRTMFVTGLLIFTVASLAIGLAQSAEWLIAARAIQGVGAATLAPSTLALLQTNFPAGPERTRAIAYYAAAAGVSASVGLVIGGLLADWLSWRVASRERAGAYAARILFLGANVGFFFFSTQFMQAVRGMSPTQTGMAFLPAMIVNFVTAMTVRSWRAASAIRLYLHSALASA